MREESLLEVVSSCVLLNEDQHDFLCLFFCRFRFLL